MKYAVPIVRLVFGAWFIMSGWRYFQPNMPMGRTPVAMDLMQALVDSNLMLIVKLIELGVGAMLVLDLYVPLALLIGFPVTVVVGYVCLIVEWPATRPLIGGGATVVAHVLLLLAYRNFYRPIWVLRAKIEK